MATKLKDMHLTSVDLVRAGANQNADICLYKSAERSEREKNVLKRFIHRLMESSTESHQEPTTLDKNSTEMPDCCGVCEDGLAKSVHSIIADDTLTADEADEMLAKSVNQYRSAIAGTVGACSPGKPTPDIDEIEEIDSV